MGKSAKININGDSFDLPIIKGSENEQAIDISKLRSSSGYITLDGGYGNTGSCQSAITFIDGEKGILRYRGIPIEELATQSNFVETAYLIIFGKLPTESELKKYRKDMTDTAMLHEDMKFHFEGFPPHAHPMAILSAMINAASCFECCISEGYVEEHFPLQAARLMSMVRTIAAFAYRKSLGKPINYPKPSYWYVENFLHMLFSEPYSEYELKPEIVRALDLIFLLHADHEQNCSTSTVRMIASSQANLFACASGGVCALWGPLHGGANQAVIEMLETLRREKRSIKEFVETIKSGSSDVRLMGFGHRVYKSYDPRAKIIKNECDKLLDVLHIDDPLLDLAKELEEVALQDEYFVKRKLYPNVDFYSGIIMRALGIPLDMFTVIFSIGRMPGWIANYKELMEQGSKIYRPRQIYTGPNQQAYIPMKERE